MRVTAEADRLVFVDVETTGFSTDYDRIIQICIMSGPQSFVTYVNPKRELDSRAMAVNGISEADVRLAPPLEAISQTIYELLGGKIIVGHNVCFDLRFIASELKASGLNVLPFEYICTMSLEKMIFGAGQGTGFYTLPACLERIGVVNQKAHDALHDVLATKRLFEHQLARIGSDQEIIRRYPNEDRLEQREAAPKVFASLRGFAGWGTQSDAMTIDRFNCCMERALDDGEFSEQELVELASLRIDKAAAQAELSKAVVAVFRECMDDGVISLDEYEFIEKSKSILGLNSKQLYPVFKQLMPTLKFTCFDMMPWMNADGSFFEQEEEPDIGLVTGYLLSEKEVFRYALYRGYYPTINVTKETDLCVNGHSDLRSHTQTRTAEKYGIPVVKFAAFAAELDMPVNNFVVRIPTPVKVGELATSLSSPPTVRRPPGPQVTPESNADIEVIQEYQQVCALLSDETPLLFVTGGAGTGKLTLIRYLRNKLTLRIAVVAPTGVAALNARGVTIHSLFCLPPTIIQPTDVKEVCDRQLYKKLDLLIVDEVSMVRPDVLDGVDRFLRLNRGNDAPFGGVQLLLIGDLFQLPPVAPSDERRALRQMNYATDFFFSSSGIADCRLTPVLLQRVFRQTDPSFISLLNDIREGKGVGEALHIINARCTRAGPGDDHELVLTCTNRSADDKNRRELSRLTSAPQTYTGSITGDFRIEKTRLPAPVDLVLKPGAQVMFTKNDDGKRWVNGTIGKVVSVGQGTASVEIENDSLSETVEVEPVTWEQYRYEYDPTEDRIAAKVVGRYTQLPLILAWAITIHKAQGKTLDRVFVDLGHRAFAAGQVYVALSRVRSLEDLRLARPIREEEVRCDPNVTRFYMQLMQMTQGKAAEQTHSGDA